MRLRLLTLQIFPQLPIMGYRAPFFWFTSLLSFNEARDYPFAGHESSALCTSALASKPFSLFSIPPV